MTSHLDLEDLIAEGTGAEPNPTATDHLADCATCRTEAGSWTATAAAVRRLTADTEPPETLIHDVLDRLPAQRRRRRRWLLPAAAACMLLAGLAGYGISHFSNAVDDRRADSQDLLIGTGCNGLMLAHGRVDQLSPYLLRLSRDGRQVEFAVSGQTRRYQQVPTDSKQPARGTGVLTKWHSDDAGRVAYRILEVPTELARRLPDRTDIGPWTARAGTANAVTSRGFVLVSQGEAETLISVSSATQVYRTVPIRVESTAGKVLAVIDTSGDTPTATTILQIDTGEVVLPTRAGYVYDGACEPLAITLTTALLYAD